MAISPDTTNYFRGASPPGLGSVGQYQSSGQPYLTGSTIGAASELAINIPFVTKQFTIKNLDAATDPIFVHFASAATSPNVVNNKHYLTLDQNTPSFTFNVRTSALFLTAPIGAARYELYAELTSIVPPNGFTYNIAGYPGVSE